MTGDETGEIRNRILFERLREFKSKAQIGTLPEDKRFISKRNSGTRKRYMPMLFLAATLFLVLAFFLFRNNIEHVGIWEYRSGYTTIIRSGHSLSSSSFKQIQTGDILETHNGRFATLIDDRIQLLINANTLVRISGKDKIGIDQGEIWVYVLPDSGHFQIQLPRGSVHVVGTSFGILIQSEEVRLRVMTGSVIFQMDREDI